MLSHLRITDPKLNQSHNSHQTFQSLKNEPKMQINDHHILSQQAKKIVLKSAIISPSQFDVEFTSTGFVNVTGLQTSIEIENISDSIICYQVRTNNSRNYSIAQSSKVLQSREKQQIIIKLHEISQIKLEKDKIQIQVIKLDEIAANPHKIWQDKAFLLQNQIEEQIMKIKVSKSLMSQTSPSKSIQKQKFIQDFFIGQSNNTVNSQYQSSYNWENSPLQSNRFGSEYSQDVVVSQPIFNQKMNSLSSPKALKSQFTYEERASSARRKSIARNYSPNNSINQQKISNGNIFVGGTMTNSIYLSANQEDGGGNIQVQTFEEIKRMYERLLIHVDEQEKHLSQLSEEKEILNDQLENFNQQHPTKNKNTGKNGAKLEKNKSDQKNKNQKQQAKGMMIWKLIIFIIIFFWVGFYHGSSYNSVDSLTLKYSKLDF